MKALLEKIRKLLKDKRFRRIWYRYVSGFAAIVVFVTTYALVLPAITLEKTASCGMEEHQHDDSCYEERLICGQEESDGHHHDDSCYEVTKELVCGLEEHRHSKENGCYDEEGNLICELPEHTHDDSCYKEVKTLICGQEESEGHHHTDACYEKVLVCGKEAHTHSAECYKSDSSAVAATEEAAGSASTVTSGGANSADPDNADNTVSENAAEDAAAGMTDTTADAAVSDSSVPTLDPVEMDTVLTKDTDFYYFHAEEDEEIPADSADITDWQQVKKDTKLEPTDLVKMYLAYEIPAGSLNETNAAARYRLPGNIHLTDDQIKAINKNENGIAIGYKDSDTEYKKYLGAEAVEGDRKPDEELKDGAQEYISAVVKAENVYDEEGLYGEKGAYLGQDLIFTFVPYTVEKNQNTYDADGSQLTAGKKITGWFACDFTLDQIDWIEEENEEEENQEEEKSAGQAADADALESSEGDAQTTEKTIEKTAEFTFVKEDKEKEIEEIKRSLTLVEQGAETSEEETPQEVQQFQSGTLVDKGDGYRITLDYTPEAQIPENAALSVREITAETDKEAYEACLEQTRQHMADSEEKRTNVDANASRFFDIEILVKDEDGSSHKIEPAAPVSVNIQILDASKDTSAAESQSAPTTDQNAAKQSDPTVLHFKENGVEQMDSTTTTGETPAEGSDMENPSDSDADSNSAANASPASTETTEVQFEAESFSIYGVVYTVDFAYDIDGKSYTYHLQGGSVIGFRELLPILGVVKNDPKTQEDEVEAFVKYIASVRFSNEILARIEKIEEDTTVGDLENLLKVTPSYSGNITESDVKHLMERKLKAIDWIFISLMPFDTKETMTITLQDGEVFTIDVTDAGEASINDKKPGELKVLPTADTRADGIKMWLFDYDLDQSLDNQNNKANTTNNKKDGINSESDLKFLGWGAGNKEKKYTDSGNDGFGINDFTGLDQLNNPAGNYIRALQGVIKNELVDDYPVLNNGQSLDYLFDPTLSTNDRKVYGGTTKESGNITGLFEKGSDGYYIYDSDQHYAELTKNGSLTDDATQFTVYTTTMAQTNKDGSMHDPKRAVGFFPFDTYKHVYNDLKYENDNNNYGNYGTLYLNPDGTNGASGLNHHLGVGMEMDFIIPKGGKDENGNPIKFNFSGDDDMWVFIDDQLVLDIGGLHQPVDGTIDFSTGEATITGKATQKNHSDNTGSAAIATVKGVTDNRGNDFAFYPALGIDGIGDNQIHTMRIFYLERGGCDSNCMISFNLPLVKAKGSVTIAKCEKPEEGSTPTKKLAGVKFGVYKTADCTGTPVAEVYSDANGLAEFANLPIENQNSRYYVKELQPLPGYKENTEIYTLIPDVKLDEATYVFKVVDSKNVQVGTIGQEPQIYPVILNEREKTELKVNKIWKDEDGKAVTGPDGAQLQVTLNRYKLVKKEEPKPKGTLVIKQTLTGTGVNDGKQYYQVDYIVKKDDQVVASGTYSGTDGFQLENLDPGTYTVETICKSTNSQYSVKTSSQKSTAITVPENGSGEYTFTNELTKIQTQNTQYTVTIHSENDGQSKTFTYYAGTNVSLIFDYQNATWIKTSPANQGGGYGVKVTIDGKDKGAVFNAANNYKVFSFTVNGNTDVCLTNTGYSNWTNVTNLMSLSPADVNGKLKAPMLRDGNVQTDSDNGAQDATTINLTNSGNTPAAPEGYTVNTEDDDVKNWTKFVNLPDGTSWEKVLNDLEKYDAKGNPYVYYIGSVTETGLPEGTEAAIQLDGENKQVVRSDSEDSLQNRTLSVNNKIPAVVSISAGKAWKNRDNSTTPPAGATVFFRLYADGEATNRFVELNGKKDVAELSTDPEQAALEEVNGDAIAAKAYESECWKASWIDLPKYKYRTDNSEQKVEIAYTVQEATSYGSYKPDKTSVETGETITNTESGGGEVIPGPDNTNPEIHKRIDALRDGAVNPDSPHDNEDKTDLYRLYLDYKINSLQTPEGVDLLLVLDHSGSMNFKAFSGNPNRAPTIEKMLNGENGLITEFMKQNENNRWAAVGFKGAHGLDYQVDILDILLGTMGGHYNPNPDLPNDQNVAIRDSEILSPNGGWTNQQGSQVNVSLDKEEGQVYVGYWPFGRYVDIGSTVLTNYTAGFWRAEQLLQQDTDRKKVVIFISDGIPTLYIPCEGSLNAANSTQGSGYYPDSNGEGGCPKQTLEQFRNFIYDVTDKTTGLGYTFGENLDFYTVGFGTSFASDVSETSGEKLLKDMLTAAYGSYPENHFYKFKDGNVNDTADKMKKALGQIVGTGETFKNVKIKDDLSKYVDLYGLPENPETADVSSLMSAAGAKVTMTKPDPTDPSKTVTTVLYENGAVVSANNSAKTKEGTTIPILREDSGGPFEYDADLKEVTLVFYSDYEAEPGVTYTLSFDVKATQDAYDEYGETGYNNTGDEDTDFLGTNPPNATSVDKLGFHSNDSAIATYTHNGNSEDKTYKHPVIQVSSRIRIVKEDQEGKLLEGAKFTLYKEGYDPKKKPEENEPYKLKEMTSAKEKPDSIDALIYEDEISAGTYYLVETKAPDGYNLLENPIVLVITQDSNTGKYTITATMGGKDIEYPKLAQITGTSNWKLIVTNDAGVILPNTGGHGTDMIYLLGITMICLAGVGFVMKRRRRVAA